MPTPPRHHPRLATTRPTSPGALPALARERFLPRPPDHWRPWFWLAALLLHIAAVAALLFLVRQPRMKEAFEPTGISVVYDSGATQAQAPRQAPIPAPVQSPAPAPPPAAPQAQEQPEVNLNLPTPTLSPLPEPLPQQAEQTPPQPHHVTPQHQHSQRYVVMNNMSLSAPPAPPTQFANKALNLNLGGADELPANVPQITIQGHIGTDWQAGFNKWVNEHIYYPDAAAEQGQQGASTIQFTVHRDGHVTDVHLLNSAGSPFLDQAWMGIFLQNNVPPFPPNETSDSIKITATLNYVLEP